MHQKDNQVLWMHIDPVTNSTRETNQTGFMVAHAEFDPLGNDAPLTDPSPPESTPDYLYPGTYDSSGNIYDGPSGCMIDGQQVPCSLLTRVLNFGTGRGIATSDTTAATGSMSMFSHVWVDEWESYDTGAPITSDAQGNPIVPALGSRNVGGFRTVSGGALSTSIQQRQPQRPGRAPTQPVVPIENLRGTIETMLKQGKGECGKFVQQLLDQAAKMFSGNSPRAKTILEAFDNISSQAGYVLTEAISYHTVSGNYYVHKETGGAAWALSAMAHIMPWYNLSGRPPSARTVAMAQAFYAKAALHETFHLAARGGFSDKHMALAASELTGAPGLPKSDEEAGLYGYSEYWDDELSKRCPELRVR